MIGEYAFAGQYQQTPAPYGGELVKGEWFVPLPVLPGNYEQVIQSWDTANKAGQFNDFSVCLTAGLKEGNIYLLNVYRKRLAFPDLKRAVIEQYELFKPNLVLVEDRASGVQLIQEMHQMNIYNFKAVSPTGDKTMRMHVQTSLIENGFVYVPKDAHWLPEYLYEMSTFPRGKHDDQVDATSQLLEWHHESRKEPGALAWIRMENEKLE